jgi:hypothetical protein
MCDNEFIDEDSGDISIRIGSLIFDSNLSQLLDIGNYRMTFENFGQRGGVMVFFLEEMNVVVRINDYRSFFTSTIPLTPDQRIQFINAIEAIKRANARFMGQEIEDETMEVKEPDC